MSLYRVLLVASVVSCVASPTFAQQTGIEKSPGELLTTFQRGWDESTWTPESRRRAGYMRPLNDAGWKIRFRVLQGLVAHGRNAVPDLAEALKSDDVPTRILAAQTLGYLAQHVPIDDLKSVFSSESSASVRLYAADALGMQGNTSLSDFLSGQLKVAKNGDVRRHLSYAIERGSHGIEPAIVESLKNWDAGLMDSARVGKPAPDFELKTVAGKRVRLSDFGGKQPVVLIFIYGDT
jgi:hypothetical protein